MPVLSSGEHVEGGERAHASEGLFHKAGKGREQQGQRRMREVFVRAKHRKNVGRFHPLVEKRPFSIIIADGLYYVAARPKNAHFSTRAERIAREILACLLMIGMSRLQAVGGQVVSLEGCPAAITIAGFRKLCVAGLRE